MTVIEQHIGTKYLDLMTHVTNQNASFVFEFGISINELRLKCWYVQKDQGATTNDHCLQYMYIYTVCIWIRALCGWALEFG